MSNFLEPQSKPITAAIDLGYGLTKYTKRKLQPDGSHNTGFALFPSIAIGVDRQRFELKSETVTDVKLVQYNGES